jgi:hypothetical protein
MAGGTPTTGLSHATARNEILERLSSNSEAYDKAILTLASALLALSVTFIKDLLPSSPINHVWLLYGSWIVLTAAIIGTVLSFRISDAALAKQLDQIDQCPIDPAIQREDFGASAGEQLDAGQAAEVPLGQLTEVARNDDGHSRGGRICWR